MAGFVTPTHMLLLLVVLAVVLGVRRLGREGRHEKATAPGRRPPGGRRRLSKPTPQQAHVVWLIASALVAFALTRAVALPLFLLAFLAVWACGFWLLVRLYR